MDGPMKVDFVWGCKVVGAPVFIPKIQLGINFPFNDYYALTAVGDCLFQLYCFALALS